MSSGEVVQVIGAVVDVKFPNDAVPKIYDALKIDDSNVTLEVQQQLGDSVDLKCRLALRLWAGS
jgi:F-type H+-transporting ATPase subunit beta